MGWVVWKSSRLVSQVELALPEGHQADTDRDESGKGYKEDDREPQDRGQSAEDQAMGASLSIDSRKVQVSL